MTEKSMPKVLLVEDNAASAEDFLHLLERHDFAVAHAVTAQEAIEKAAAFLPDVVLLDLQIPSAPGLTDESVEHGFRTLDALLVADRNEPEDAYRTFIHRQWKVILGPEYRDVKSPYPITRGGEIDLLAIRPDGFSDLWELKRPSDPVFKDESGWLHHSVECARAVGQLMSYYDAAEKERPGPLSYEGRRSLPIQLHRPRGFVVIGRYKNEAERERLRLENSFLAGLAVLTYDDLIERAEQFLLFLQSYRNGDEPVG